MSLDSNPLAPWVAEGALASVYPGPAATHKPVIIDFVD